MNVVITGASRGIGLELTRQYTAGGAQVWGTVRRVEDLEVVRDVGAEPVVVEVTDPFSVAGLARTLDRVDVDLLINNAGVPGPARQSTLDMDFDAFSEVLAVNTLGPLRVTQALLPRLVAAGAAKLVVVTSRMGSLSYAKSDTVAYRASKAAANKVTQCLATDLQPLGVAVAALHPGWVRTDIGGPHADLEVGASVRGMRDVIARLTLAETGRFWDYDGSLLEW